MASITELFNKAVEPLKNSNAAEILNSAKLENKSENISSIYEESETAILRYPLQMDESQRYKTLRFYIIKQQSWDDVQGSYKRIEEALLDKDSDLRKSMSGIKEDVMSAASSLTEGQGFAAISNAAGAGVGTQEALNKLGEKMLGDYLANPENYPKSAFENIIMLPIPNNLMESENHNYTGGKFDDSKLIEGLTSSYGEIEKLINSAVQSGSQLNSRRRQSVPAPQMPVLNPFLFQKYEGSETKEYGLVFFLVPRTLQEAEQCMKISYLLKKYSYPSRYDMTVNTSNGKRTAKSGFLLPPNKVLMKFNNPMLQKLINPGVCVIKSVQTTYNEGTTVGMTIDGVPRFIEINMTLTEYNQKFQEDF